MSTWMMLMEAVDAGGPVSSVLDRLSSNDAASLVKREVARLGRGGLPAEAVNALTRVFVLGAEQVRAGVAHNFLSELVPLAGELGGAGCYLQPALDYLQTVLEHQSKTRREVRLASRAVGALARCLKQENRELTESALLAFGMVLARVPQKDRRVFLETARALGPTAVQSPFLVPSLERYHDRLARVENAATASTWAAKDAFSVITIHSHKGGVGKTTVAIALALELARRKRRVCVVDCDDEGPSLHYCLPVDATSQKDALFFCDWFCSGMGTLPEGLVQRVIGVDGVSFVAGSFLGVDITRLDEYVADLRQRSGAGSLVEGRIAQLIQLLLDKDFDSVIVDTSPGLTRLSLEVLTASFRVGGSRVFVMRPRPVDIAQLCVEEDWIVRLPGQAGSTAVVLNFFQQQEGFRTIDLGDALALTEELTKWAQFEAYSKRFSAKNISDLLRQMVQDTWPQFANVSLGDVMELRHAGSFQGPSPVGTIRDDAATRATGQALLDRLQERFVHKERRQ